VGAGALAQAAQRLWGLLPAALQKPPGRGPGHPALGGAAGAGAGTQAHREPCLPQSDWSSGISLNGVL